MSNLPIDFAEEAYNSELSLSPRQVSELMEIASAYISQFFGKIADGTYPASYVYDSSLHSEYSDGLRIAKELREERIPEKGRDIRSLLDEVFGQAMTNGTMHPHPGFMAHVPSGGLFQGALGDFIARAVNRFAGVWIAAPGFQQLESNVIRWFCAMLGYEEKSFGYLTTGGSLANLMGLICANTASFTENDDRRLGTYYVSAEGHFSVVKAAQLLGVLPSQIRIVEIRSDLTMDTNALAALIQEDRGRGRKPVCVVATAGTTNTGAIDDLNLVTSICKREKIWCHIDACFGGFFNITERGKSALVGISNADSISVDAHKSLFLPHGTSALLVKEQARLKDAFEVPNASYLPGLADGSEVLDFCSYGPDLSREIRGLTAWLPLKMHGIKPFRQCLDEKVDLAKYLVGRLSRFSQLEVIQKHRLLLPIVNFRVCNSDPAVRREKSSKLCELICMKGNAYLTMTEIPGEGPVIRACILHHDTNRKVIDQLVDDVDACLRSLDRTENWT